MIMTFRMAVKTIAKKHGLYATFMPKPVEGISGSGMHVSFVAQDSSGANIFVNETGELSETAGNFIGGVLSHAKGMTLITNPIVNSYKRLVPGYDAPVNISWSKSSNGRSALIRIPSRKASGTRVEVRNPDATCNPYLAIAFILAAGLEGIENKLTPPDELTENIKSISFDQTKGSGVDVLPMTLGEAITAFKADSFGKEVLSESVYNKIIEAKKAEWKEFRTCVTKWEIDKYLNNF